MSGAGAPAFARCADRITSKAAATWAQSRTSSRADKTSRIRQARAKFEAAWHTSPLPDRNGYNLSQIFEAVEHGELDTLYVIGENPAQSEADQDKAMRLLGGLKCLIVQDIFLTKTGELADVVFPASASWCESEGTVTNSERRVQRVRKALNPPGEARDDIEIIAELSQAARLRLGRRNAGCDVGRMPQSFAVASAA